MFNLIPPQYRIAAIALLAIALFGFGYVKGLLHERDKWETANAKAEAAAQAEISRLAQANALSVSAYAARIKQLQARQTTITREVTKYVPATDNASCRLPDGFKRLHDLAAKGGIVPETSGSPATAAPGTF